MKRNKSLGTIAAGAAAGTLNGLLGAGGGMVLVPLLTGAAGITEEEVFPSSVAIMLPVCAVSLVFTGAAGELPFRDALPWLFGSAAGGLGAGFFGRKIPVVWLHRILGLLILWGGIRYLW